MSNNLFLCENSDLVPKNNAQSEENLKVGLKMNMKKTIVVFNRLVERRNVQLEGIDYAEEMEK